jgi:hypothetical protein
VLLVKREIVLSCSTEIRCPVRVDVELIGLTYTIGAIRPLGFIVLAEMLLGPRALFDELVSDDSALV